MTHSRRPRRPRRPLPVTASRAPARHGAPSRRPRLRPARPGRRPGHEPAGTVTSHGLSIFGDLKYPADFKHFDYVNPDAPKGGTFRTWDLGSYNSLTPFTEKGDAAVQRLDRLRQPDGLLARQPRPDVRPDRRERHLPARQALGQLQDAPRGPLLRRQPADLRGRGLHLRHDEDQGPAPLPRLLRRHREGRGARPARGQVHLPPRAPPCATCCRTVASTDIFSKAYYEGRDFSRASMDPPLGSGRLPGRRAPTPAAR